MKRIIGTRNKVRETGKISLVNENITGKWRQWLMGGIRRHIPPATLNIINPNDSTESNAIKPFIEDMKKHNIIEECFRPRAINRVFLKLKDDNTFRIVFDARTGNRPFVAPKIELPSPHKALQKGKYYVKFDITNGYWHFPLHRNARPFYAFKVDGKIYQSKVLPFGDKRAPYEFTRIFKYILNRIRRKYKIKSKLNSIYG